MSAVLLPRTSTARGRMQCSEKPALRAEIALRTDLSLHGYSQGNFSDTDCTFYFYFELLRDLNTNLQVKLSQKVRVCCTMSAHRKRQHINIVIPPRVSENLFSKHSV